LRSVILRNRADIQAERKEHQEEIQVRSVPITLLKTDDRLYFVRSSSPPPTNPRRLPRLPELQSHLRPTSPAMPIGDLSPNPKHLREYTRWFSAHLSADSSYITAPADQSTRQVLRSSESESGESAHSKDTEDTQYPSSSSEDRHNAVPSPETTPEQPQERRVMGLRLAMGLPAVPMAMPSSVQVGIVAISAGCAVDTDDQDASGASADAGHSAGVPDSAEASFERSGMKRTLSVDDMTTPHASAFQRDLPGAEGDEAAESEYSPTPRKTSGKSESDVSFVSASTAPS
jgi:hypothetical protein